MTDSQLKLGKTWSGSSSAVTEYIRMANIRNKKSNTACNKIPAADRGHEVTAHQTDQEHHKVGVEVEVARPAAEDMDAGEVACTPRVS